jgi:hypothetical protein
MRRAARIDNNQKEIVKSLRDIPSVTVATNHDDILVGFEGKTYWYEIKSQRAFNKDGKVRENEKRPGQKKLLDEWKGHYKVVTSLEDILKDLKIIK